MTLCHNLPVFQYDLHADTKDRAIKRNEKMVLIPAAFHGAQSRPRFIQLADERGVCRGKTEIPLKRVPYLRALQV